MIPGGSVLRKLESVRLGLAGGQRALNANVSNVSLATLMGHDGDHVTFCDSVYTVHSNCTKLPHTMPMNASAIILHRIFHGY